MPLSDLLVSGGVAQTLEGIDFVEKDGSLPVEMAETITGQRTFYTAWADRVEFTTVLRGFITSRGDDSEYIKTAPQAFPGYPLLVCVHARVTGFGTFGLDDDDVPEYDLARIDAMYAPLTVDPDSSTEEEEVIATLDIDFSSEIIAFGSFDFDWATNGNPIKEALNIGKVMPLIAYSFNRARVPIIPKDQIFDMLGKVNDAEFEDVPAGQLLFTGARSTRSFDSEGNTWYSVNYDFVYRPQSWNTFFNSATGAWDSIRLRGVATDYAVYASGAFDTLFTRNTLVGG